MIGVATFVGYVVAALALIVILLAFVGVMIMLSFVADRLCGGEKR